MKVTYQLGKFNIEFETESQKDLFGQLSSWQEVFGEQSCGKCSSENLRFVVRENDGNQYYELRCMDCGAKLAFGVNRTGNTLFPRRKDSEGNWLPDNGWTRWDSKSKKVV